MITFRAIAHGVSHIVGSIEEGKLADLVFYRPELFGTKPEIVLKGGQIIYAQMGDANASIPTTQPVIGRKMYGYYSDSSSINSLLFVSRISLAPSEASLKYRINNNNITIKKKKVAVKNCRNVRKKDMKYNSYCPVMSIDPETYEVRADGELCICAPAGKAEGLHLPMNQVSFIF